MSLVCYVGFVRVVGLRYLTSTNQVPQIGWWNCCYLERARHESSLLMVDWLGVRKDLHSSERPTQISILQLAIHIQDLMLNLEDVDKRNYPGRVLLKSRTHLHLPFLCVVDHSFCKINIWIIIIEIRLVLLCYQKILCYLILWGKCLHLEY